MNSIQLQKHLFWNNLKIKVKEILHISLITIIRFLLLFGLQLNPLATCFRLTCLIGQVYTSYLNILHMNVNSVWNWHGYTPWCGQMVGVTKGQKENEWASPLSWECWVLHWKSYEIEWKDIKSQQTKNNKNINKSPLEVSK